MILVLKIGEKEGEAGLFEKSLIKQVKFRVDKTLSSKILDVIKKALSKSHKKLQDLEGIILSMDPSTFSSQRIAITVVNSFCLTYKTPLCLAKKEKNLQGIFKNSKKGLKNKYLKPIYFKKPNITLAF